MTLTDEEIRVKVAELMGWTDIRMEEVEWGISESGDRLTGQLPTRSVRDLVPDYLNDPLAALQLCDRMHSEGWTVEQIRRPGEDWIVSLFKGVIAGPSTTDPSLARAVTLCFLAAHS